MTLTRFWWVLGFLFVGLAVWICLVPGQDLPGAFELNDKVGHAGGHALLALYFTGLVPRRGWWKIFALLLLLGMGIEFAQYHMHAGREGDPRDVLANSTGSLIGLLLGFLGISRWPAWAAWLLGRRPAFDSDK